MNANDAFNSLRSTFIEWDGFLVNNRYLKQNNVISWEEYDLKKFLSTVSALDVFDLIDRGQYTFQVSSDGSIFQIYYEFDQKKKNVEKACLCYYKSGVEILHDDQSEIPEDTPIHPTPDAPIGWFRLDYSNHPNNDGGMTHPKCHLHLSLFPSVRMAVDRLPNPKQFVDFIIASCYPDVYKQKRLDETGRFADLAHVCQINDPLFPDIGMSEICEFATHLHVPVRQSVAVPLVTGKKKGQLKK